MPIQTAPCEPWPLELCCPGLPEDLDPALIQRWQMVATQMLWRMSGMRWGPSCPITVRPCGRSCLERSGIVAGWGQLAGRWIPYVGGDGKWYNANVCSCGDECHCGSEICEVRLDGPVHDIIQVRVNGAVLEPEAYRVDAANMLVRLDGDCWPSCSDMLADCDQPGAFCVQYRWGLPLDASAIAAVSEMTCQLVAACLPPGVGDCRCQLPGRVQRVARQGVTVDLVTEATSIWREGRTGLPLVDAFLATVNPDNLSRPSRVMSPDAPRRPRMTTWIR